MIELKEITAQNEKRSFTTAEKAVIKGHYVYALQDPRDDKVFYVGQGSTPTRPFDHLDEAQKFLEGGNSKVSSKILRIIDIWAQDFEVQWYIIAHGLTQDEADKVEAAVIDAFNNSQNGRPLNDIDGKHSSCLLPDQIIKKSAQIVSVSKPCKVFVFNISNTIKKTKDPYEAVRSEWKVNETNRNLRDAYAVGVVNGISEGAYKIDKWRQVENGKYAFDKAADDALVGELVKKDWNSIIGTVMGYWQRGGGQIIVEFDGKGNFRVIKGAGTNPEWKSCLC